MRAIILMLLTVVAAAGQISYADAILPQLPTGCGWSFSIVLVNLVDRPIDYRLNFWAPEGVTSGSEPTARRVRIIGYADPQKGVEGTIMPRGLVTVSSVPVATVVPTDDCNGWAELTSREPLGGYAILTRHSFDKEEDIDTTIPFSSRFAGRFVFPMSTMPPFTTSFALVNPSFQVAALAEVSYFDNKGNLLCEENIELRPGQQKTVELDPRTEENRLRVNVCGTPAYTRLDDDGGLSGVVQVLTRNLELSGFGLRFRRDRPAFVAFPGQTPIGH